MMGTKYGSNEDLGRPVYGELIKNSSWVGGLFARRRGWTGITSLTETLQNYFSPSGWFLAHRRKFNLIEKPPSAPLSMSGLRVCHERVNPQITRSGPPRRR